MIEVSVFGKRISYRIEENMGFDDSILNKLVLPKHKSQMASTAKTSSSIRVVNMNLDFDIFQIYTSFLILERDY